MSPATRGRLLRPALVGISVATVASGSHGEIFESGTFWRFVADGTTPS